MVRRGYRPGRFEVALAVSFCCLWIWLAVAPVDRGTWLLENVLTVVFAAALVASAGRFPMSRLSYSLIFLFLCFHSVGAHYTYSLVPYDDWARALSGRSISEVTGWERNHYDRVAHFLFGALLGYPAREIFVRIASARGFWGYFLPLLLTMSLSMLYELIEWAAALVFGGDLGIHYLGTQGDEWDGHRDMALASLGALLAMLAAAAVNLSLQRDFAREWHESLRVKRRKPLGETAVREMLDERGGS